MENHASTAPSTLEAPSTSSIELTALVSIWVEVLLYGIYACLFFESLYIMLIKRKIQRKRSGKIILITIFLMYMVATVDIALNLYRLMQAYVWLRDPAGPVSYFLNIGLWVHFATALDFWVMTWLGDALVIYRCFLIWNESYVVIILPSLLLVFSIVTNAVMMYCFRRPCTVFFMGLMPWVDSIYLVNLVQNILTTGLIVFKILRQHRISTAAGARSAGSQLRLTHVVRIVVESALVYTVHLLILIVLHFRQLNAQYVQHTAVPTIGIVFNLIAVRIHMTESGTTQTTRTTLMWADNRPNIMTELDGTLSYRTDEEALPIAPKRIGVFAQAESLGRHSGRSRSLDIR